MAALVFVCSEGASIDSSGTPICAPGHGAWAEQTSFLEKQIPAEQIPLLFGAIFLMAAVIFVNRKVAKVFGL